MSRRIKGITVEIGGDTTKLSDALSKVNRNIRDTQSQLRDVNRLLKLDPGNADLIAQKHRMLGQAVEETKNKLESLKRAEEQAKVALADGKISQEQYDALKREIIATEQALESLEKQAFKSNETLQKISVAGEKWKEVGGKIEGAGKAIMPVSAGVIGLGTVAVKTASDFDTAMSRVKAVSGATGDEFDLLRDKAREMGAKTIYSATDAAEALNYMAMSGWETNDMLAGIEGVMNLAAASGEDFALTADIVTDALTAFGLEASDAGRFSDILAATASSANTNVALMGETFKYVVPVAGALGFSVDEVAEAIGLMANSGIKGSQAGTALRGILTNLTEDITFTSASFGELTIATQNQDGSMRNLNDILDDCRGAFSHMTEAEAAMNAETLVGKQAMSGFLALVNAAPSDVDNLRNAIENADGTAVKMSETMTDNLYGSMEELQNQLEDLAIAFGDILMPAVRSIVDWLASVLEKFNQSSEGTKKLITVVGLFVAALGPLLITIGKISTGIGALMTAVPQIALAFKTFTGFLTGKLIPAIGSFITSIGPIPAAIAAVVGAIVLLWNKCEWFRDGVIGVWEFIKEAAINIWTGLGEFLTNAWTVISETAVQIWSGLKVFFQELWEGIKVVFEVVVTLIYEFLIASFTALKDFFIGFGEGLVNFFTTSWDFIKTTIQTVVDFLVNFLSTAWGNVSNTTRTIFDGIRNFLSNTWQNIQTVTSNTVQKIVNFIRSAWTNTSNFLSNTLTNIRNFFSNAWNTIRNTTGNVMNSIRSTISNVWNSIYSYLSGILSNILSYASSIFSNMLSGISSYIGNIYQSVVNGFNSAASYITGLANEAYTWGTHLIRGLVRGIQNSIGWVVSAVRNVANTIRSYLHFTVPDVGPLTDYKEWMPHFMQGLARGIDQNKYRVVDSIKSLASDMVINPRVNEFAFQSSRSSVRDSRRETTSSPMSQQANQDIIIPVYLGGKKLDEVIVNAQKRQNLRSGGR